VGGDEQGENGWRKIRQRPAERERERERERRGRKTDKGEVGGGDEMM
jgi:hypothetical protein